MPANQLFTDWVAGDIITATRLNSMKNNLLALSGGTVTGNLTLGQGKDLILQAAAATPTDPGDLVFYKADGTELARIYVSSASGEVVVATGTGITPRLAISPGGVLTPTAYYTVTQASGIDILPGSGSRATTINTPAAPNASTAMVPVALRVLMSGVDSGWMMIGGSATDVYYVSPSIRAHITTSARDAIYVNVRNNSITSYNNLIVMAAFIPISI